MNVVEKAGSNLRPNAVDFDRFRLRRFIESLGADELDTRDEPIDLAGLAEVMEGNPKAVLFRAAGPEQAELVGNVMGGRVADRAAFGVKPERAAERGPAAASQQAGDRSRSRAPRRRARQVVLTGKDADVTKLPVHLQHGADGGPYISAADRLRRSIRRPASPMSACAG